jgi:hypothetical protein
MNTRNRALLVFSITFLATADLAFGTQPPDVVTTDANGNTAMGSTALINLTTGLWNTASGWATLNGNTSGSGNTADGYDALGGNSIGAGNTATGEYALVTNDYGNANTAVGANALYYNFDGNYNSATGASALFYNVAGNNNTAIGYEALYGNTSTSGNNNTATGYQALYSFTSANDNTATGYSALYSNSTGNYNTASGYEALYANTVGNYNNASGYYALRFNTAGAQNSASGVQALLSNKTGNYNTASGTDALYSNSSGSSNIAEGYKAGFNLTTGSNNIDIGNMGAAAESATIRIGTNQTATYVAGIYGTSVTGSSVVVSSSGQLGVTVSSERFKTAITPMGSYTAKLTQLRPVTFHLKTDPKGALQSGLIAEEVAKVYPELVIKDASGRIDGVRYDELAPMLLNEMQKRNAAQDAKIRDLEQKVAELKDLKRELYTALRKLDATTHFSLHANSQTMGTISTALDLQAKLDSPTLVK